MTRARIIALFAILILVIGAGAATSQLSHHQPPPAQTAVRDETEPIAVPQEIVFEWKGVLDYFTESNFFGSSQTFEANDGVKVFLATEDCISPRNAARALEEEERKASKIMERGTLLDEKGQVIGDRVVASFATAVEAEERISILRTERQKFYLIESSSLRHALLLEGQFFNGARPGNAKGIVR